MSDLKLYKILPRYIDVLRDESKGGDKSVYIVDGKENRPFVGVCKQYGLEHPTHHQK